MRQVTLPSGATLTVNAAPFAQAKALYQALLREVRGVAFGAKVDMAALYRDLFCAGFSSPEVESALWDCFARCTYDAGDGKGAMKIDKDTFEPVQAREDYTTVSVEVAKENVYPFTKSLFAEFQRLSSMIASTLGSNPQTTTSSSTSDSAKQATHAA